MVLAPTSVGWTDDKQREGEAVANHFGMDWNDVRAQGENYHHQFRIAPSGGRYRYISPKPLGSYLAVEAWNTYPELLKSLPEVLPMEEAKNAYNARLQSISSSPEVQRFAREQLAFFFREANFVNETSVQVLAAFSSADPGLAAREIHKELASQSPEQRRGIKEGARRSLVSALVGLAWQSAAFQDAVKSLALFAEAENESWGNNATEEFIGKFFLGLGGTAVPYPERLGVLAELLAGGSTKIARMVVRALVQVGNTHESRMVSPQESDVLPEPEWHPKTNGELIACAELAVQRLCQIAQIGNPELREELRTAADEVSLWLLNAQVKPLLAQFFKAVLQAYPDERESMRRSIASVIRRERKYWKNLSEQDLKSLAKLHAEFENSSLSARLRQHVGEATWDKEEETDLSGIASDLMNNEAVLAS